MYIKISEIYEILKRHPYFSSLSNNDKIEIVNVAWTNYHNLLDEKEKITLLIPKDGYIGDNDVQFKHISPYRANSNRIFPLGTIKYEDIEKMSENWLIGFSDEAKMKVYSYCIKKIQILDKEVYQTVFLFHTDLTYRKKINSELSFNHYKSPFYNKEISSDLMFGYYIEEDVSHSIQSLLAYDYFIDKPEKEFIDALISFGFNKIDAEVIYEKTINSDIEYGYFLAGATSETKKINAIISNGYFLAGASSKAKKINSVISTGYNKSVKPTKTLVGVLTFGHE